MIAPSSLRRLLPVLAALAVLCHGGVLRAATLPQDHPYQKGLRDYLATLGENDFTIRTGPLQEPGGRTEDEAVRDWLEAEGGAKIYPVSLSAPASAYLLASIEGAETVMLPDGLTLQLATLARRNPFGAFTDLRALRLRAWVVSVIDLLMLDHSYENDLGGWIKRADYLGGTLVWLAYTYEQAKPELPEPVREAYETGLRKMVDRIVEWEPTGIHGNMDSMALAGLAMAARATGDPAIAKASETYARKFLAGYYDPAGFIREERAFDATYSGISLHFMTLTALLTKHDFLRDTLDRMLQLRNILSLPEPPGAPSGLPEPLFYGPSHFSTRTSGDTAWDQWGGRARNYAAAMISDRALPLIPIPDPEELRRSSVRIHDKLQEALAAPVQEMAVPWKERHWSRIPPGVEFFTPEPYRKLLRLREENSPLLRRPFERPGSFVERLGDSFVVAKFGDFGVILFCGKVGGSYNGSPHGFGGGNLSAFWTKETGAVILGRRRGAQGTHPDAQEEWRERPVHAISGRTREGREFTSSRQVNPERKIETDTESARVEVSGEMGLFPDTIPLRGTIRYHRLFEASPAGLTVTSRVEGDGKDDPSELYEIIPLFERDDRYQSERYDAVPPFTIEFRRGDQWSAATAEPHEGVSAVRVTRHRGAIEIRFSEPRRVRLSAQEWEDAYQSRVICRNVLVDFPLERKSGEAFRSEVSYRITAAP